MMKKILAITALAATTLTFTATTADAHIATPTWVTANSVATGDQDAPSVATNRAQRDLPSRVPQRDVAVRGQAVGRRQ